MAMTEPVQTAEFDQIPQRCQLLRDNLSRVIVGQTHIIEPLLAAVMCEGHALIVGVPGLAKTLLVRSLADSMNLSFKRIQFTPDMMPSDILGIELIQQNTETNQREMQFVPGPIFSNLILADEVNRAPPKTQAALLEAMAERQVTTAGQTMQLKQPFVVVATQNPIEQEGTYPLPEAQLDRFMFSLWMEYPGRTDETQIVMQTPRIAAERLNAVFDQETLLSCSKLIEQMPVSEHVVQYAVDLARATRPNDEDAPEITKRYVSWGAGPRAGQSMILGAKSLAAIDGEPTPSCDHVRRIAMAVLRHRIVLNYVATGDGVDARQVIDQILEAVSEPTYEEAT